MKSLITVFIIIILLSSGCCPKTWEVTFGGNSIDAGYSVDVTSNGKYVIAGKTVTKYNPDSLLKNIDFESYLLKIEKCKSVDYAKAVAFPYVPDSMQKSGGQLSTSIQQTRDKGYIIAGSNLGSNKINGYNFELVKFNPEVSSSAPGRIEWDYLYGGSDNDGYPDGELLPTLALETGKDTITGYTLAGSTGSFHGNLNPGVGKYNYFLMHTDKNGIPAWAYAYAGKDSANYYLTSFCEASDGGYVMCGYILTGSNATDFNIKSFVIKTDASGHSNPPYGWSKTYEIDTPYQHTQAECIQQTFDGGYIITGWALNTTDNNRMSPFLLKIGIDGDNQWIKTYNVQGKEAKFTNDEAHYVQQTGTPKNNGFVVAGVSGGNGESDGAFLMHTDKAGIPDWTNTYGLHDYVFFSAQEIKNSNDMTSGYIAVGKTRNASSINLSDVFIAKTNADGKTACSKKHDAYVEAILKLKINNITTCQTPDLVATHILQMDINNPKPINWGKQNDQCR